MEKVNLGNINLNVNIDKLIRIQRIKYLKNLVLLRMSRRERIKQRIDLYGQIKQSRIINSKGGNVWL